MKINGQFLIKTCILLYDGMQTTGVRSMVFNPDGRTILSAMHDSLKVSPIYGIHFLY
jgi:hypothetical protein